MSEVFGLKFLGEIAKREYFLRSKSEQEVLVVTFLIESGFLDLSDSKFANSQKLGITQSKFDSYIYAYRTKKNSRENNLEALASRLKVVSYDGSKNELVFSLEDKFLREFLVEEFKRVGVFSDTSFNREFIHVKDQNLKNVISLLQPTSSSQFAKWLEDAIARGKWASVGQAIVETGIPIAGSLLGDLIKLLLLH